MCECGVNLFYLTPLLGKGTRSQDMSAPTARAVGAKGVVARGRRCWSIPACTARPSTPTGTVRPYTSSKPARSGTEHGCSTKPLRPGHAAASSTLSARKSWWRMSQESYDESGLAASANLAAAAAAAILAATTGAAIAWKTPNGVAKCVRATVGADPYKPGQAIGAGLKSEMWKAKHPNLTILETREDTPVLGLLSVVRNAATEGAAFVSAANRLTRQLLDAAVMGLPCNEEAVFATPAGVMMQGVLPEEDLEVCAITLHLEHEPRGVFDAELDAAFPSFKRGSLHVRGLTRGSGKELPRDMAGKQVLLLTPVVIYKEPVLAALERLEQVGVHEKDVTLVCVVISKDAAETLSEEADEMNVVCGAMDGQIRGSDHQVVPGVGDFSRRYFDAKKIAQEAAKANATSNQTGRAPSGGLSWWWPSRRVG